LTCSLLRFEAHQINLKGKNVEREILKIQGRQKIWRQKLSDGFVSYIDQSSNHHSHLCLLPSFCISLFLFFVSSFLRFFLYYLQINSFQWLIEISFCHPTQLSILFSNFLSLFLPVFLSVYVSDSQPGVCEEPEGVHKMPNFSLGVRDHRKVANRWSICIWEFVCLWLCLPILYSFFEKMLVGFFIFSSLSSITQLQKSRAKQFSFFKYDFIFPSICLVTISCEWQYNKNREIFFQETKIICISIIDIFMHTEPI
jgi:hypothetical protein